MEYKAEQFQLTAGIPDGKLGLKSGEHDKEKKKRQTTTQSTSIGSTDV